MDDHRQTPGRCAGSGHAGQGAVWRLNAPGSTHGLGHYGQGRNRFLGWLVLGRSGAERQPGNCRSAPPPPNGPNCAKAELPYSGFGQYCINCHASADNSQDTFATTRFVLGGGAGLPLSDFPPEDNIHYRLSHMRRLGATPSDAACMIPEQNDHVVAGAKPLGPQKFVTSDQCTGCHNATATLTPARTDLPSMLFYTQQSRPRQSICLRMASGVFR